MKERSLKMQTLRCGPGMSATQKDVICLWNNLKSVSMMDFLTVTSTNKRRKMRLRNRCDYISQ